MSIEGRITQDGNILIPGFLCKQDLKIQTNFVLDTGFVGYDVAIPYDAKEKLQLKPTGPTVKYKLAVGVEYPFLTGNDANVCFENYVYNISYIITYTPYPLLSVTFLKNISKILLVDFVNERTIILLN